MPNIKNMRVLSHIRVTGRIRSHIAVTGPLKLSYFFLVSLDAQSHIFRVAGREISYLFPLQSVIAVSFTK